MNNYESGRHDLKAMGESIDLSAELTEDYHLDHAVEINELLLSMEDEVKRKPEMEKDAALKADKIHEEIIFHKGEQYKKMVSDVRSALEGGGVSVIIPDNVKRINYDYLISRCLRFDCYSKEAVCKSVSDGIFDILGLEEEKRPVLMLMAHINGRVSKYGKSGSINDDRTTLGCFEEPNNRSLHMNPQAEKNGVIRINLPNFDDEPDIRDVLATLEHECFHVYQFNYRRGMMPITTVGDRAMMAAYSYGHDQYIDSKNDPEGYYGQGYESSARIFSAQLTRATDVIVTEAIKQAIKGDANAEK